MTHAQPSPTESPRDTLTEDSLTLIRKLTDSLFGASDPEPSTCSPSGLASGMSALRTAIRSTVSPSDISDSVMDSLDWGDGDVDCVLLAAQRTKEMVLSVIDQFERDLQDR